MIIVGDSALEAISDKCIEKLIESISGKYDIKLHDEFSGELLKLVSKCGQREKFFDTFLYRCTVLSEMGRKATLGTKNFERLRHIDTELYSMHISFEKNVRILYGFKGDTIIMFLSAFDEKSGKRKTDYSNYIPIAEKRLEECMEGDII